MFASFLLLCTFLSLTPQIPSFRLVDERGNEYDLDQEAIPVTAVGNFIIEFDFQSPVQDLQTRMYAEPDWQVVYSLRPSTQSPASLLEASYPWVYRGNNEKLIPVSTAFNPSTGKGKAVVLMPVGAEMLNESWGNLWLGENVLTLYWGKESQLNGNSLTPPSTAQGELRLSFRGYLPEVALGFPDNRRMLVGGSYPLFLVVNQPSDIDRLFQIDPDQAFVDCPEQILLPAGERSVRVEVTPQNEGVFYIKATSSHFPNQVFLSQFGKCQWPVREVASPSAQNPIREIAPPADPEDGESNHEEAQSATSLENLQYSLSKTWSPQEKAWMAAAPNLSQTPSEEIGAPWETVDSVSCKRCKGTYELRLDATNSNPHLGTTAPYQVRIEGDFSAGAELQIRPSLCSCKSIRKVPKTPLESGTVLTLENRFIIWLDQQKFSIDLMVNQPGKGSCTHQLKWHYVGKNPFQWQFDTNSLEDPSCKCEDAVESFSFALWADAPDLTDRCFLPSSWSGFQVESSFSEGTKIWRLKPKRVHACNSKIAVPPFPLFAGTGVEIETIRDPNWKPAFEVQADRASLGHLARIRLPWQNFNEDRFKVEFEGWCKPRLIRAKTFTSEEVELDLWLPDFAGGHRDLDVNCVITHWPNHGDPVAVVYPCRFLIP
ncbi:MAG: hypothetical protein DWQ01_12905 [Planctomycetota bacterium]|nr:MAG: hypothetical protein DWQ01_12905 [Planctomycetota bacterium]